MDTSALHIDRFAPPARRPLAAAVSLPLLLVGVGLVLAVFAALGCGANTTPQPTAVDAGALSCLPNLDGRIDAKEVPIALNQPITYLVSPSGSTRNVNLAGMVDSDGVRVWDFSAQHQDDKRVNITAVPLGTRWYAGDFPGGEFAAPADATAPGSSATAPSLDAVYAQDGTALWLYGYASTDPNPSSGRTLLVYDAPVALLRFPITATQSYTATGHVSSGEVDGLPYSGTDTYHVDVGASGRLLLGGVQLTQVRRVDTTVTVAPDAGGQKTTRRQTAFWFECFGAVVQVTSRTNETAVNFSVATEVRRLAL